MPQPKITDQFWFDLSKTSLENSLPNLDKAIIKLSNYIIALWALYTTASIISLDYRLFEQTEVYWYIIIPHILLLVGRWFILRAQLPFTLNYNPHIPNDIKNAYMKTYSYKRRQLNYSKWITLIATFSVVIVLTCSLIEKNENAYQIKVEETKKKAAKSILEPTVRLDYIKDSKMILVNGIIVKNVVCTLNIKGWNKKILYNSITINYQIQLEK